MYEEHILSPYTDHYDRIESSGLTMEINYNKIKEIWRSKVIQFQTEQARLSGIDNPLRLFNVVDNRCGEILIPLFKEAVPLLGLRPQRHERLRVRTAALLLRLTIGLYIYNRFLKKWQTLGHGQSQPLDQVVFHYRDFVDTFKGQAPLQDETLLALVHTGEAMQRLSKLLVTLQAVGVNLDGVAFNQKLKVHLKTKTGWSVDSFCMDFLACPLP